MASGYIVAHSRQHSLLGVRVSGPPTADARIVRGHDACNAAIGGSKRAISGNEGGNKRRWVRPPEEGGDEGGGPLTRV